MIVRLKIDVKKIDKARLFNGAKGTYLDATLFIDDEPDAYGNNGRIVQDVSKEERAAGTKGAILGNCKIVGQKPQQKQAPRQSSARGEMSQQAQTQYDDSQDIPF